MDPTRPTLLVLAVRLAAAAGVALGAAACAHGAAGGARPDTPRRVSLGPAQFVPLPGGGIADCAGRLGVLVNAARGLDAVQLATGATLWTSAESTEPIALDAARVLAWRPDPREAPGSNRVRLVVLDARTGARVVESEPLVLPAWAAWSSGSPRRGVGRWLYAALHGARAEVLWVAMTSWGGGYAPSEDEERRARHDAAGLLEMDLARGTLTERWRREERVEPAPPDRARCAGGALQYALWTDRAAHAAESEYVHPRWLIARDAAGRERWRHRVADADESPGPP